MLVLAFGAVLPGTATADWPVARHDPQRTGQATGRSDIREPVAYWKRYIGGRLEPSAFLSADVDGDGATEFLMLIGGSAVAKERSDLELWRSPNLELTTFIGLTDLDGNGTADLVARSLDRVYVLEPGTGRVVWAQTAGEMGQIGGTRLGDVDGDNLPDLVVEECGCCRVIGPNAGFVYSFAANAAAPRLLWELPFRRCGGQNALTLVDADGVAPAEVLIGDTTALVLLDGATGAELARTPAIGTRVQESRCVPADLDATAGEELVCARDARLTPTERGVFALRYQGGQLQVMWTRPIEAAEGGAIDWVDLVEELDGTGGPEVVVSGAPDGVTWTTYVLSGATGQIRATVPGEIGQGMVPTPNGAVLLTASGFHLSGWQLVGGALVSGWAVPDITVPSTFDLTRAMRSSVASRAALALVDSDDNLDIVAVLRSQPGTLVGYDVSTGTAIERGRHTLPANVSLFALWTIADAADADLQLAIADDDGFLTPLDRLLRPVGLSGDDVGQARIRTGGHYATGVLRVDNTLRSAAIDDGPDRLLLLDSRGSLIVLDASLGSFAAPPRKLWEVYGARSPAVIPNLDGDRPGVACLATDQPPTTPPSYSVLALDGAGQTLWRQPAPAQPFNDVLPGTLDADGVPDLVYQWGNPGDVLLQTRAVRGTDGGVLWDAIPVDPGAGRNPKAFSLGPFDGDGLDDVYHQVSRTQVLSGASGAELDSGGPDSPYGVPTLANLDDDPGLEVALHGGPDPIRVLDHDLASTLVASTDANRPFPSAAIADCGTYQVLVGGSDVNQARLKLTDVAGAMLGRERTTVLAAGAAFSDEATARAATDFLGALTSVSVHQNLTGEDWPTAVVGSSDGHLYAVDPCTGALVWSYAFGAAVGEPIFSDTDGDGRDEIQVTVQDGNLYQLRNFEIAAPEEVRDTDPFSNAGDDLDELTTESTLEASWPAVAGADRYVVAVVDAAGNYVGNPWHEAGPATVLALSDLPLEDGFYRLAVRAVRADGGYSVDTVSDGVWVVIGDEPGGCCRTSDPGGSIVLVLVTAGVLARRRRSARAAA